MKKQTCQAAGIWWHSVPAPECEDCPKRCCHCPGRLLAPFSSSFSRSWCPNSNVTVGSTFFYHPHIKVMISKWKCLSHLIVLRRQMAKPGHLGSDWYRIARHIVFNQIILIIPIHKMWDLEIRINQYQCTQYWNSHPIHSYFFSELFYVGDIWHPENSGLDFRTAKL